MSRFARLQSAWAEGDVGSKKRPGGRIGKGLTLVALTVGIMGATASAASAQLDVFAGYADNLRTTSPAFPTPWQGSPSTTFIGTNAPYDAGAIRLVNNSSSAVSVQDVKVDLHHGAGGASGPTFDIWGSFTVPANGQTVLTQTVADPANLSSFNFDTSDSPFLPCGSTASPTDPRVPTVTVTLAGGTTFTLSDKGHVLDTGGGDPADCFTGAGPVPNESHAFVQLGTRAGTFSCRASAVSLLGTEPTVANGPNSPCVTDSTTGIPLNLSPLLNVGVLNAATTLNTPSKVPAVGDSGSASASVANVAIGAGGTSLNLQAASSTASVTCQASPGGGLTPVFTGSSNVVALTSGGGPGLTTSSPTTINLGLVTVYLNRQIQTATELKQRAVQVDLLGTTLVVLGESDADLSGSPCSAT